MRNVVTRVLGRVLFAGAVIATVGGTSGCKSLLKKKQGDGGTATGGGALSAQDQADEQLQEKLDEYIKCLNSLASSIHQSRHRYLTYIPRTGPTGRETYADLYRLPTGASTNCAAGISRAKAMPPPNAQLENAGSEFSSAASDVDHLIVEMDRYYENKDFRDDKWAKGKLNHPRLMASFNRFSTADKALHDTLDGITKPLAQRTLGRIEREEGKRFRYFRKKVLISARELVEAGDPVGDDDDVDFQLYSAAYTTFEKSVDELTSYGGLHKSELTDQRQAANWPLADSNYESFVKESNDFKKAAKEFWRCMRDAPAKAKTPSGKVDIDKLGNCAERSAYKQADEVITQYNEFIKTSNGHQFP
jgi:hypothetical protein